MRKLLTYIPLLLQFAATFLLLSVVCISSRELPPGEMAKQWWWLGQTGSIYMVLMMLSLLFYRKKTAKTPDYACIVSWALILLGGWEAIIGLRQIYGFAYSNHSLFSLTGTFFNPGPYSGYLALVFPLCLHEYYRLKTLSATSLPAKIGHYIALVVLLLMVCVLPAGMSRSAWFAAGASAFFVAWQHNHWGKRLRLRWAKHKKQFVLCAAGLCICLFLAMAAVFMLKKDSANGRLFMWRMSLNAIAEHPLAGHGATRFPVAYGNAQEAYFARGQYAEWEEHVAGSPEYAFNEYLQIGIEYGIPVLVAGLAVVGLCLWQGIRKQRTGVCAAILSLGIFSFSSYPLQLPVFIITLIVLLFACIASDGTSGRIKIALFSLAIGATGLYLHQTNNYNACKEWTRARMLYNVGAYSSAKKEYALLYPALNHRAAFMFEYSRCLNKLEEYEASNRMLQETSLLTCDPMVFNIIGKNCQMLGEYEEAEKYLFRSVNRLPGRIYPYYLLAKLYADPECFHLRKFEFAFRMVMEKEPKVQSTAIREMREEVRQLKEAVMTQAISHD